MAKKTYVVESEAGAGYAAGQLAVQPEVGDEVRLELSAQEEQAVIAAGWFSQGKKGGKG